MITPNKQVAPPTLLRSRVQDEVAPAAPLLFSDTTASKEVANRNPSKALEAPLEPVMPQRPAVRPNFEGAWSAFTPRQVSEPVIEAPTFGSPGTAELSVFVSPLSSTSRHLAQMHVCAKSEVIRVPCELPAMTGQPLPAGHFEHIDPATPTRVLRPHRVSETSPDWRPVRVVAKRH